LVAGGTRSSPRLSPLPRCKHKYARDCASISSDKRQLLRELQTRGRRFCAAQSASVQGAERQEMCGACYEQPCGKKTVGWWACCRHYGDVLPPRDRYFPPVGSTIAIAALSNKVRHPLRLFCHQAPSLQTPSTVPPDSSVNPYSRWPAEPPRVR
jgi:hypothetical protein